MNVIIRLCLFAVLTFPLIGICQATKISFKYDTLELRTEEKIVYRTGDILNGEVKYSTQDRTDVVKVENGYIIYWVTFNSKGQKLYEHSYAKGNKNGPYKNWNKYGVLVCSGNYLNGKPHGHWTFYYNNGKKESEGMFISDSLNSMGFSFAQKELDPHVGETTILIGPWDAVPDGEWKFYNKNGELEKKLQF